MGSSPMAEPQKVVVLKDRARVAQRNAGKVVVLSTPSDGHEPSCLELRAEDRLATARAFGVLCEV
jgi:hypothetical protein